MDLSFSDETFFAVPYMEQSVQPIMKWKHLAPTQLENISNPFITTVTGRETSAFLLALLRGRSTRKVFIMIWFGSKDLFPSTHVTFVNLKKFFKIYQPFLSN
jgi:hypothetical protein